MQAPPESRSSRGTDLKGKFSPETEGSSGLKRSLSQGSGDFKRKRSHLGDMVDLGYEEHIHVTLVNTKVKTNSSEFENEEGKRLMGKGEWESTPKA